MALKNRLPAASGPRQDAEAGLLLAYGSDFSGMYRQAAGFVDKIFNGAKPADLPIQQPTKFQLVQSSNGQGTWCNRAADPHRARRRGDRIAARSENGPEPT
jgi:hypothetical protein